MRRLGIAVVALAIVPSMVAAQADTSRMRGRDTTRRTMHSSSGAIGRRNYGLSHDQISQLQTALQQANCNPGAIDGILGPRTRSAMACARRNNNITTNNPNDLLRSLNLSFTAPDSMGMGRRGMRGAGADTSMNNMRMRNDTTRAGHARRGRNGRMGRDTTMGRRSRPDSTRRPGMTPRPGSTSRTDTSRP